MNPAGTCRPDLSKADKTGENSADLLTPESPFKVMHAQYFMVLLALLASGIASIINQVIWQRALKIYVSGSEAVSSMIIVFVFMLGLGVGAWLAGRVSPKFRNPLRTLGLIEFALAAINAVVCFLLTLDIQHSIYALQRLALEHGVPLRWLYGLTASALLAGPCILMGMTVPVASEASQRQLGQNETRFLSKLFFLNTLGAVVGALVGSIVLLPLLGQRSALLFAAGLNAIAGALAIVASFAVADVRRGENHAVAAAPRSFRPELLAGFCLGFLALAYEMYIYRQAALVFTPRPYTFAFVLTGFLLVWSAGVHYGGRYEPNIPLWLSVLSVLVLSAMPVYLLARWGTTDNTAGLILRCAIFSAFFAPCFPFGVLFTGLVANYARSWGKDVGRYFACNTFGSCLGIVVATLAGFEFGSEYGLWSIATGGAAMSVYFNLRVSSRTESFRTPLLVRMTLGVAALTLLGQIAVWQSKGRRLESGAIVAAFYGKGGVVEVDENDNLIWDGLWHSKLSRDDDHIGTNNWKLAIIPLLCHAHANAKLETCVVGLGTGITAGTLARSAAIEHVDVYEINDKLAELVSRYPDGTLHVGASPKVTICWEDGRTGLALRDKRYDLITQQPLYLKQAGSSALLSREYMELVKSRLKEGGMFCIYCNAASDEHARTVRQAARLVFPYAQTFGAGYMIVASATPIQFDEPTVMQRLGNDPTLRIECEAFGIAELCEYKDSFTLSWDSKFFVSDDLPTVEYPDWIRVLTRFGVIERSGQRESKN
jgi:spermidine synthase